jgi:hypothetical protein
MVYVETRIGNALDSDIQPEAPISWDDLENEVRFMIESQGRPDIKTFSLSIGTGGSKFKHKNQKSKRKRSASKRRNTKKKQNKQNKLRKGRRTNKRKQNKRRSRKIR